ncbi:MAG TPA: malectin domain-containing carbohydrate-binding protein [Terriglobales bacterium]|nr:malectin domain-containing carbohydrate-binding protein [Terriglobales bacterium]
MTAVATTPDAERSELERVLQSELFQRAPSLSHLLAYVCEKTLVGQGSAIKEYSIAVDVFGRDPAFDHESDSIVRVQANRLRKHLAQYYASEGANHEIHISIPVGQYAPVFETVSSKAVEPVATAPVVASHRRRNWMLLAAVVGILAVASGLFLLLKKQPVVETVERSSIPAALEGPVGPPVGEELRILPGAEREFVDHAGKRWGPDRYFSGGMAVHSAVQHIWRTQDAEIYRNSRQGEFTYDIPLKGGVYELRMHFAETEYGPEGHMGGGEGSRLMAVTANGKPLLTDFDVVSDASGSRTADVKVFTDVAPASDGKLHLKVASVHGGRGMLSGIEVLPGVQGKMRSFRMVMRDSAYYSDDSRWWAPDNYFLGGQMAERVESVAGVEDPELYQGERWGNFSYAIPVAQGRYTVVLHFVERRGTENRESSVYPPRSVAGGERVFNVVCNGRTILSKFDILKESRVGLPVMKKITGLEPNAQGKLVFEFVPVKDYATLSAVEVVPE